MTAAVAVEGRSRRFNPSRWMKERAWLGDVRRLKRRKEIWEGERVEGTAGMESEGEDRMDWWRRWTDGSEL